MLASATRRLVSAGERESARVSYVKALGPLLDALLRRHEGRERGGGGRIAEHHLNRSVFRQELFELLQVRLFPGALVPREVLDELLVQSRIPCVLGEESAQIKGTFNESE